MSKDIVISGISGRFAESDNTDELWTNLVNSVDMVTEDERRFPKGLFGLPSRSGKIKQLAKFDAQFFGYTDVHANINDPLMRILHEVVFEAIIDSGTDPAELSGKKIGVFVANDNVEGEVPILKSETNARNHSLNGTYRPLLANNISYFFNFNGPSLVCSSGCSAGGTALNQAVLNIEHGQCEAAIVAGCHLSMNPLYTLSELRRGFLSADGKAKFMDEKANGYPRSEICCALYIQRAKSAKRIYAKVIASHVSHDGFKEKRYAPSRDAISAAIVETLKKANVDKKSIRYVECHGAGTQLGDQAEVHAIAQALCTDRADCLPIGSVKTNLGHAESGAAMSSLAKVLLSFEHGTIPASLCFQTLSTKFDNLKTKIMHTGKNIEYDNGPVLVISFGYGGSNSFTLLEPYQDKIQEKPLNNGNYILPLFSRTEEGINVMIDKLRCYLQDEKLTFDFMLLLYQIANLKNMSYRGYVMLNLHAIEKKLNLINQHFTTTRALKKIIFNFQDIGDDIDFDTDSMIKLKTFNESLLKSKQFYSSININLPDSVKSISNGTKMINNIINHIAMIDLLLSLNILPDKCIGNAFGQLFCAFANRDITNENCLIIADRLSSLNIDVNNISSIKLGDLLRKYFPNCYYIEKFIAVYLSQGQISKIEDSIIIEFSSLYSDNTLVGENCHYFGLEFGDNLYENMMELIGKLYELGIDVKWSALYANSGRYPVSRGTQSVVPLLQWDHSKDYFVTNYKNFI